MRKATLVLATSVAFLLFGVPNSYAGIKKKVELPTAQSVANGSGVPVRSGNSLSVPGALQGEFIPGDIPSRSTPIKVLPTIDFSIPRTIAQTKNYLKGGLASLVVGGVIAGMLEGLDWVMGEGGKVQVPKSEIVPNPTLANIHWSFGSSPGGTPFATPTAACTASYGTGKPWGSSGTYELLGVLKETDSKYYCHYRTLWANGSVGIANATSYVYKHRATCAPPATYSPILLGCVTKSGYVPATDADLDLIDAYVNAQSAPWLHNLLKESCSGSLSPDRCFEDLKDNVSLSGPATVSGPSTLTTTTGPNGTTTKDTKTTFAITYGSDYFIYAPTTTTTTVNPDGTTEVETEEETAEEETPEEEIDTTIPDLYKPVIDKYDSISGEIKDAKGPGPGITYGAWYSFGGACHEINTELPIVGSWSTAYCPYIYDYVRPVLAFLFLMFTWHTCYAMFQNAVQTARPI